MASIPEQSGTTLAGRVSNVDARASALELHASGWVNVKTFKAKGDGVTDDTAAIQAAYDALGAAGGTIAFPPGTYRFNLVIAKPNIHIRGAGRSATASQGGNGATVFKPALTTAPVLQIGDGAAVVNHISFSGFTVIGTAPVPPADNTSDGIVIRGAYYVNGTDFTVEGFGGDNVRIESTAARPSFYINLTSWASRWARGAGLRAVYGSSYVTAISISAFAVQANTSGAYAVYLDAVKLNSAQGWIQCAGNRVGHVYLTGTSGDGPALLRAANVDFDSDTSTDSLVEFNYARGVVADHLAGFATVDGFVRWQDASTTDLRGSTAVVSNQAHFTNPLVIGNLYFNQNNASSTDEPVPGGSTPKIVRNGTGATAYLQAVNAGVTAPRLWSPRATVTYGAQPQIDASTGNAFVVTATDSNAFTIRNPTNTASGQRISVTVVNASGGALGTVTWGTSGTPLFKMAAWTSPANGFSRTVDFVWNGTYWVEVSRTPADVPN